MRFHRAWLPALALLAPSAPGPSHAAVSISISAEFAPPPLPVYDQPPIPGRDREHRWWLQRRFDPRVSTDADSDMAPGCRPSGTVCTPRAQLAAEVAEERALREILNVAALGDPPGGRTRG